MSNRCVMCGSSVPDGQRICSMCYGDPYHGRDGYYLAELERARAQSEREEQIQYEAKMGREGGQDE